MVLKVFDRKNSKHSDMEKRFFCGSYIILFNGILHETHAKPIISINGSNTRSKFTDSYIKNTTACI